MKRIAPDLCGADLIAGTSPGGGWWAASQPPRSLRRCATAQWRTAPVARTAARSIGPNQQRAPTRRPGRQAEQAPQTPDDQARLRAPRTTSSSRRRRIDAARQGDPAAQYYLSSALTYCESLYDWYFIVHQSDGAVRTPHAGRGAAAHRVAAGVHARRRGQHPAALPEAAQDVSRRLSAARANGWMPRSRAGFPLAQASAALNLALQGTNAVIPTRPVRHAPRRGTWRSTRCARAIRR